MQSYLGQLCFGLIACRRAVPDVQELAAQLQRAMVSLRRLAEAAAVPAADAAAPAASASANAAVPPAGTGADAKPDPKPDTKPDTKPGAKPRRANPQLEVVAAAAAPVRAVRPARAPRRSAA